MTSSDRILAAIARLSPKERDRLWRRARQMGLVPHTQSAKLNQSTAQILARLPRSVRADIPSASPEKHANTTEPLVHITLVFDGGSKGNPGPGYGSFEVSWNGATEPVQRLTFGDNLTNNEAEYDTLITALTFLLRTLQERGIEPGNTSLVIRGDSKLVLNQVNGAWKAKEARLRERRDRVRALLDSFGQIRLSHQPRTESVARLGH